jgi:hypothetical protein
MTTNEVQGETGLIGRCKRINGKLGEALALTIEITGQHYDDNAKTTESDEAEVMSNLQTRLQLISLKVNNLMTQLEHIKEQF